MSKDITPEVGDVWEHYLGGIKINIESVAWEDKKTTQFNCLRCDELNCKTTGYIYQILPRGTIKKYYTYLGKSKANINDLFKTENEE